MLVERVHGHTADRPTVLGEANGEPAIQVYATGLYEGVRKGDVRWVTGTAVQPGLDTGNIVEIDQTTGVARADIERTAEHERAAARDHVASPPGAMFEPRQPATVPSAVDPDAAVPEATDVDVRLAEMSKPELTALARLAELPGRSAMDKGELYEHLRALPNIGSFLD